MHIRSFGLWATIVLRDEFLSWKVLRDAKSMGTAVLDDLWWQMWAGIVDSVTSRGYRSAPPSWKSVATLLQDYTLVILLYKEKQPHKQGIATKMWH